MVEVAIPVFQGIGERLRRGLLRPSQDHRCVVARCALAERGGLGVGRMLIGVRPGACRDAQLHELAARGVADEPGVFRDVGVWINRRGPGRGGREAVDRLAAIGRRGRGMFARLSRQSQCQDCHTKEVACGG